MTIPQPPENPGNFAVPADSALPGWLAGLPKAWQPYAMLARLDRPVGVWLLFLPCLMGLGFARLTTGLYLIDLLWTLLFLIGAIVMRGAGCTWNDITDKDFDAKVARTAARPIPSGAVTTKQAYIFLLAQLAVGFLIWLALPWDAKIAALLALPLVAIYPYTKRVTWWPQAWLGLTFNWGVFVGAATASVITGPVYILYAGLILWTIAYDTIYALQDREDDALIGVRSTARLFGERAVLISFGFHMGAAALIGFAAYAQGAGRLGALTALLFLAHGAWQAMTLKTKGEGKALAMFKSNVHAGAIVAIGFLIAAMFPQDNSSRLYADHETVPEAVALPFGLEQQPAPEVTYPDTWFASDMERALEAEAVKRGDAPTP
ncbi:4-hydroxybenzoate polyprenyl transferase [Hyphomonas neptunium ATCC 15444]|uniref:4-hydroxybenzoate octaprenyltransferase n=2 Tax=Hyphomonas TaxID=85 RepID=Q0C2F8_HYPNA|nr:MULTISPECIES: 4-hydroxybenzoate octaprenyltransferase [Hyphomonas]ABI77653.1 4-hydroxybenzoate polyprenyl transferase [Hyphomonas neptunium ATCC 15444]KCZ95680.1 4-hydroxybenzoate polyprenyltransferase [Hyphomonas hirschiana VP5]